MLSLALTSPANCWTNAYIFTPYFFLAMAGKKHLPEALETQWTYTQEYRLQHNSRMIVYIIL